jgi:hypothetical protein
MVVALGVVVTVVTGVALLKGSVLLCGKAGAAALRPLSQKKSPAPAASNKIFCVFIGYMLCWFCLFSIGFCSSLPASAVPAMLVKVAIAPL